MACMFNQHNVSVNGVPQAAPAAGAVCDCGEMVAQYQSPGVLSYQYTPTGRLQGR